ncbi:hypothetical protein SPD48_01320 [Pseudogracilibacillus sp. SE30717A]|uniref:hypothetical protein n=1 Tax=Pseudogracilibacillus sp. SE30717A TaxID=3098293 RepID=UPI00300E4C02
MRSLKTEIISFEKETLKQSLEKMDANVSYKVKTLIYYPYLFYEFLVEPTGRINRVGKKAGCTIDGMNKVGAVADQAPEFIVKKNVDDKFVLRRNISIDEAKIIAEKFLFESIYSRMKILKMPTLRLKHHVEFYRPYWIVKGEKERSEFYLTVDAITGKYHPL